MRVLGTRFNDARGRYQLVVTPLVGESLAQRFLTVAVFCARKST